MTDDTVALQTQEVLDRGRIALLQHYQDLTPAARARVLARSVLAGVDVNSQTLQALADMVFADWEDKR